jgi:hypothetical protein
MKHFSQIFANFCLLILILAIMHSCGANVNFWQGNCKNEIIEK